MIIYLPLQARLNRTLDYSLLCHRLEIATERYNNNVPAKFIQQGCSILSTPPPFFFALSQPSKLKFLRGRHLVTNSLGLGRLFYKSSRQLQNFRRHGDQNGRKLEGCEWLGTFSKR